MTELRSSYEIRNTKFDMLVLEAFLRVCMCKVDEEAAISMAAASFDLMPLRVQQYTPCWVRKISSASTTPQIWSPKAISRRCVILRHDRVEIGLR